MTDSTTHLPNLINFLAKNPDTQAIIDHIAKYKPELLKLLDAGFNPKMKYANAFERANSIPYIKVDVEKKQWIMPEIDFDNIENGIGGECYSITNQTIMDTKKHHGEGVLNGILQHNGHRIDIFSRVSERNHCFISMELGGKKIIFDPALQKIARDTDNKYEINKSFDPNKSTRPKERVYDLGHIVVDYVKMKIEGNGLSEIIYLGRIQNTPYFLGLSICSFEDSKGNTYVHPYIQIFDQGLNMEMILFPRLGGHGSSINSNRR